MKTPHKHAELIKLWADGAEIEQMVPTAKGGLGGWQEFSGDWNHLPAYYEYRIKPEPKPDVVEKYKADAGPKYGCVRIAEHWEQDNLKLTFDGETGKLKSAEVI